MDITIHPGKLSGHIQAIPSKSQAHRLLICAALADEATMIHCSETNRDMDATAACLNAMGAEISKSSQGYLVTPIQTPKASAILPCRDSGSTLRFLLPLAGALGIDATFLMEGRLPQRPLSPLWEEMERMGCHLTRPTETTIRCQGKLKPGAYSIDGGVSSQFITGLLLALPLFDGESSLTITGKLESKPYVTMTLDAMRTFDIIPASGQFPKGMHYHSPKELTVEGDWSNGAFFLAANALGSTLTVDNLNPESSQGDRAVQSLLMKLNENIEISAADIPDLVPILSVVAACRNGARFTDIGRLRLKESDRVASVISMLEGLGGRAEAMEDTLTVYGTGLTGGTVNAMNDHRIAMSAAIAATVCQQCVTILGSECVNKSYPKFWEEYRRLGGHYEQYLR